MENLERRLRRVERNNRILLFGMGLLILLGITAWRQDNGPLRVKGAIYLTDKAGAKRVSILATETGGSLLIHDDKGNLRISLATIAENLGPSLTFRNERNEASVNLDGSRDLRGIFVSDEYKNVRVCAGLRDGKAVLFKVDN